MSTVQIAPNSNGDAPEGRPSEAPSTPPYAWKWLQPRRAGDLKRDASASARRWVWQDYIAEGTVNLLAAYAKVGKSTFLYPLLVAISQGKPFLDLPTMKTPVLILSEEPADIIQERLEALGCVENDYHLAVHTIPKDIDEHALADIGYWLSKTQGLLVVDTISEYAAIADDSDNAEIAKKLSPLKRLVRQHKATLLYVHHDRKNGEDADEGKMIRGGGEYLAIVDMAFMMSRTGGHESRRRVIRAIGRYRTIPRRTEIEWDGVAGFELVGADRPTGPAKTGAEMKVWKVLPVAPAEGLTAEETAKAADIDRATAFKILCRWEEARHTISSGLGVKNDPKKWARNAVPYSSEGMRPSTQRMEVSESPAASRDSVRLAHTLGERHGNEWNEPVDVAQAEDIEKVNKRRFGRRR